MKQILLTAVFLFYVAWALWIAGSWLFKIGKLFLWARRELQKDYIEPAARG